MLLPHPVVTHSRLEMSNKFCIASIGFIFALFVQYTTASKLVGNVLSDTLTYYETLNYPKLWLSESHSRVKRSLDPKESLSLNFEAHERSFKLRLKRDTSLFASGLEFDPSTGFHPNNFYEGHLEGEKNSHVHGFVFDDIFEGRIYLGDGSEFHIESKQQYPQLNENDCHSVIYDTKHVIHPKQHICGGMSATKEHGITKENNSTVDEEQDHSKNNYIVFDNEDLLKIHHRQRRATPFDPSKTECQIYMRADFTYTGWAGGESKAMHYMSNHLKSVSHIYESTDFNNDRRRDEISLKIKKIDIIPKCPEGQTGNNCEFSKTSLGVAKFLDLASLGNFKDYCLSYVFAHRDFEDGVLGLAWIGEASSASGGICDEPVVAKGNQQKTLNTGIVTNLNYGKRVASKVTDITLAHEIGHNFGAKHDPVNEGTCSPGGAQGNFIMYPRATSGSDPNNFEFSSCSKSRMWSIISAKGGCFVPRGSPICGNRIVETGEECDCGYSDEASCRSDICCDGQPPSGGGGGCKYSSKARTDVPDDNLRCSPSNGFCCNEGTCSPYTDNRRCANRTDCTAESFCNSANKLCPAPSKSPDKTLCNDESNVCINGTCTGSLCLSEALQECQCTEAANQCKVCCRPNNTSDCTVMDRANKPSTNLPPGSPCNNYKGYCDILNRCRDVDADGPLSRLKEWLFSSKTFDNILDWMKEYWWACVLIGLGLVLLMAGFIACCSVHTPSSNPNKPPARPMTLPRGISLRRGASRQGNRPTAPSYGQPQPYRDNLPSYDTAVGRHDRPPPGYQTSSMEMR